MIPNYVTVTDLTQHFCLYVSSSKIAKGFLIVMNM